MEGVVPAALEALSPPPWHTHHLTCSCAEMKLLAQQQQRLAH